MPRLDSRQILGENYIFSHFDQNRFEKSSSYLAAFLEEPTHYLQLFTVDKTCL